VKTPSTPKAIITPSLPQDMSNDAYYDQYDQVETTIGDGKLMENHKENHGVGITAPGGVGNAAPVVRINDGMDNDLHDYIRNTVRNLSEFAQKSGMTKTRLAELVHEGLNLA
jgi:hypothetical protein